MPAVLVVGMRSQLRIGVLLPDWRMGLFLSQGCRRASACRWCSLRRVPV